MAESIVIVVENGTGKADGNQNGGGGKGVWAPRSFVRVLFEARDNNRSELYEGRIGKPTEKDSKKGFEEPLKMAYNMANRRRFFNDLLPDDQRGIQV